MLVAGRIETTANHNVIGYKSISVTVGLDTGDNERRPTRPTS
ncbi:MAG: hypothetical protein MHPDNHAH_02243 [Anaerolineales bacterium]|nr:hypothetical protein [Anaerolineales bacterium]